MFSGSFVLAGATGTQTRWAVRDKRYALNFNHYRTRFDQKAPFYAGRHCLDLDGKSPLMVTTISYNEKREEGDGGGVLFLQNGCLPSKPSSLPCSTLAEAMCTGGTFTVVDIWLGLQ